MRLILPIFIASTKSLMFSKANIDKILQINFQIFSDLYHYCVYLAGLIFAGEAGFFVVCTEAPRMLSHHRSFTTINTPLLICTAYWTLASDLRSMVPIHSQGFLHVHLFTDLRRIAVYGLCRRAAVTPPGLPLLPEKTQPAGVLQWPARRDLR